VSAELKQRAAADAVLAPGPFLETVLDAAARHGAEGDPDHEVGDLQDLARDLWALLSPTQRAAFARADRWRAFILDHTPETTP
jgi:hypothetical protein